MSADDAANGSLDAEQERSMLINGFVHAQINVSDLDRSLEFYEMIGFEVLSVGVMKDPRVFEALGLQPGRLRGAFLRIPGMSTKVTPMLDMIQFLDPPPLGTPYPVLNHLGIARLCFQVEDIEGAAGRLESKGVELVGPVSEFVNKSNGMRNKVLCFRDPDGVILEYAQVNIPPGA